MTYTQKYLTISSFPRILSPSLKIKIKFRISSLGFRISQSNWGCPQVAGTLRTLAPAVAAYARRKSNRTQRDKCQYSLEPREIGSEQFICKLPARTGCGSLTAAAIRPYAACACGYGCYLAGLFRCLSFVQRKTWPKDLDGRLVRSSMFIQYHERSVLGYAGVGKAPHAGVRPAISTNR